MTLRDEAYSRLVATVKILLPLVAIGILSMLFLAARPSREGEPLRFVDDLGNLSGTEEQLVRPDYQSVTQDGSSLRIVAETLRPVAGQTQVYEGDLIDARILQQDDLFYHLTSPSGTFDDSAGQAKLIGGVKLKRGDGYVAQSDVIEFETDLTELVSPGPIHIYGPLGTLDANRMEMTGQPDLGSGTVTVFRGNVRVLYDPKSSDLTEE
ncbi:MAG: hypothetical protein AAGF94_16060 [Pseudomonadota bacterium]